MSARAFWRDETGAVLSAELVMILTIVVLGLIVGLTQLQTAIVSELQDCAGAIASLNQSYGFTGYRGSWKWWGPTSFTAGSSYVDVFDTNLVQAPIVDIGFVDVVNGGVYGWGGGGFGAAGWAAGGWTVAGGYGVFVPGGTAIADGTFVANGVYSVIGVAGAYGTFIPGGAFVPDGFVLPGAVVVAGGIWVPGGSAMNGGAILPGGVAVPGGIVIPAASFVPNGLFVPGATLVEGGTFVAGGTIAANGLAFVPAGQFIPDASIIAGASTAAEGVYVSGGTVTTGGILLPKGLAVPAGVIIPVERFAGVGIRSIGPATRVGGGADGGGIRVESTPGNKSAATDSPSPQTETVIPARPTAPVNPTPVPPAPGGVVNPPLPPAAPGTSLKSDATSSLRTGAAGFAAGGFYPVPTNTIPVPGPTVATGARAWGSAAVGTGAAAYGSGSAAYGTGFAATYAPPQPVRPLTGPDGIPFWGVGHVATNGYVDQRAWGTGAVTATIAPQVATIRPSVSVPTPVTAPAAQPCTCEPSTTPLSSSTWNGQSATAPSVNRDRFLNGEGASQSWAPQSSTPAYRPPSLNPAPYAPWGPAPQLRPHQ